VPDAQQLLHYRVLVPTCGTTVVGARHRQILYMHPLEWPRCYRPNIFPNFAGKSRFMLKNEKYYPWLLLTLGALFYLPFLGGVHLFDWDEINFAEISREMLITGDYFRIYVNFAPFWEKPPLFFWLQALAMRGLGVGEFAARLPNAICGLGSLLLVYDVGRRLYSPRFGLIWGITWFGTVLPFLYHKSGIIDPVLNFFILLGMYYLILFHWKKNKYSFPLARGKWTYLFLSGLFIGLGVLTKGQVALIIAVGTMGVYWVYQRFRFYINVPEFLFFLFSSTLVSLVWYGLETAQNGTWFIMEFNRYQYRLFSTPDAGHAGFPGYHFVVLLLGCFPASIFAIRAFFKMDAEQEDYQRDFKMWMKFLFWFVLILFTIVRSKIVHYSSMCHFPLTFLSALVVYHLLQDKLQFRRAIGTGLAAVGGLYVLLTLVAPWVGMNVEQLAPLIDDPFAVANLEANVRWTGFEMLPGLLLLAVLIYSIRNFCQKRYQRAFPVLFIGTGLFVLLTLIFYIKRIEGYSQRAAVEFFEQRQGEDCYLMTYAYKSYVPPFYARVQPMEEERRFDHDWLLHGAIDKVVYISAKVHKADDMRAIEDLEELYSKNGFVFFRRTPKSPE